MTKNEALRDEIADMLENLDERGLNKWGRADAIIDRLAAAWDAGFMDRARREINRSPLIEPTDPPSTLNPYRSTVSA